MENLHQNNDALKGKPTLELIINKKGYQWQNQYITGAELRKLAGIGDGEKIYLKITDPWEDEPILDDTKVNLARPGIEYFYSTKKLKLKINGDLFEWPEQFISGKEIRQLGNIDADDEIYLDNKKPYVDKLIKDEDQVDLARPAIESFYTKAVGFKVSIFVNGEKKDWGEPKITFEQVVVLAFGSYNQSPTMVYTVTYEDGPKQNVEGSMIKGSVVFVKNKMIFHATATDKS
ncbi:multiubiquitin domain-containing protein [Flavobacterium sp.]|uniref:multiubiquitin domain-containing protein n=1 Tax=Flavobacterium sp. TaxID=239 RepID=UPI0039E451DE